MPHPEYADLYRSKSRNGEFVILDNSMMELGESMISDQLLHIAERVGASEVVAPDYPGNAQKTVWELAAFVARSQVPVMMVPHGSDRKSWLWSCGFMTGLLYKMKGSLGIPKSVDALFGDRVDLVEGMFKRFALPTQVHLLGVNKSPAEILEYKGIKIRGIDMKYPIWAGRRGLILREGGWKRADVEGPGVTSLDLESDEDSPAIEQNIKVVLGWAGEHDRSCVGH
jgi:hypothetical protein